MARQIQTGATSTGLTLMYYGVCLFLLAFVGVFLADLIVGAIQMDPFTYLKILNYILIGGMVLYLIGAFLCLTISAEVNGSAFLYSSLALWIVSLGLLGYGSFVDKLPNWTEYLRLVLNILSFVLFLFFLRLLADALESKELQRRASNTIQICFFMIALFAALVGIVNFAPQLFRQIVETLGIGFPIAIIAAMAITIIVYGKLLLYTAKEIDAHKTRQPVMDS